MQVPAAYEYTNSSTAYNPPSDAGGASGRRWGDYSYTSLDPEDDMTMWTIQEFCDATNSYGVRAAKLLAPPPPPTLAAVPSSIASGVASTNVVITGSGVTAANAQGFYDPGAGFAKRLAALIPGVIVNSVTYTDSTHVTINVSTVGSTAGAKNVTVTNPDGQAVTANSLINVTGPATAPTISSANATTFTVGTNGSFTVTTTGNPAPGIARGGVALPSSVTFVDNANGTGTLSGTPAAATGGTYAITFTASNGTLPNATQNFTLTVNQAPAFSSAAPPATGVIGTPYSHNYSAIGFPAAFTYTLNSGALPTGLNLSGGSISGNPTTSGAFSGVVTLSNGVAPTATQPFTISIGKTAQTISFPAIAPFSWYQGSATLAATASSGLTVNYAVSSGPCSLAGNALTASAPGACVIAADQSGNATFAAAAQQTQSATVNVGPALLDIDASGAPTKYDAATDALMVMRFLLGYQGNAITDNVTSATSGRTPAQILTHLASILPLLDVDGDGFARGSSDGLLILRYMLNLRGAALLAGAAVGSATALQIETAIGRLTPP